MLDNILNLVKNQVMDTVAGESGIPEDKKQATVETTTSSIMSGLKKYATADGLSSITSLLGKGGGGATGAAGSSMLKGVESTVVLALTSKVGLKPAVAQSIAATVIPAVMSLFTKKVNDQGEPGFNIGSILGSLTGKGGASSGSSSGGVMDTIGGLFGKK